MVMQDVVLAINGELRTLRAECETHKENPRLTKVVDILVRLTTAENLDAEGKEPNAVLAQPVAMPAAKTEACEHPSVNVFGFCTTCGECTHAAINTATGYCLTCDQPVMQPQPE